MSTFVSMHFRNARSCAPNENQPCVALNLRPVDRADALGRCDEVLKDAVEVDVLLCSVTVLVELPEVSLTGWLQPGL